jgi:hypothetical protein
MVPSTDMLGGLSSAAHPSPAQWLITNQGDFVDHLQALMGQIVGFLIWWSFA